MLVIHLGTGNSLSLVICHVGRIACFWQSGQFFGHIYWQNIADPLGKPFLRAYLLKQKNWTDDEWAWSPERASMKSQSELRHKRRKWKTELEMKKQSTKAKTDYCVVYWKLWTLWAQTENQFKSHSALKKTQSKALNAVNMRVIIPDDLCIGRSWTSSCNSTITTWVWM